MTKRLESKYKIDRRLGINLWGRPKSPINKRDYGPGQHGQRRKKPSDYGEQLMAKQRLKGYYGNIGERQFRRIYEEAARRKGDTGENLIGLLERRLDVVEVKQKSRELAVVLEATASPERDVPDYIEVDYKTMKATLVRAPALADVPFPVQMEPAQVVEYYSR